MNVLIVDQDKSFSESMCGFLEEYKEDYCIDVCNSISKLEKILKEEDISYDIGFVDYDFVGNEFNKINHGEILNVNLKSKNELI